MSWVTMIESSAYVTVRAHRKLRDMSKKQVAQFNEQRRNANLKLSRQNSTNLGEKSSAEEGQVEYPHLLPRGSVIFNNLFNWARGVEHQIITHQFSKLRTYTYDLRIRSLEAQCGWRKLWMQQEAEAAYCCFKQIRGTSNQCGHEDDKLCQISTNPRPQYTPCSTAHSRTTILDCFLSQGEGNLSK